MGAPWTPVGFALAPGLGLAICVVAHVVIARAAPTLPRVAGILGATGAGLVAVVAIGAAFLLGTGASGEGWGAALVWALAYLALVYAYVFGFFNLGESARRVRLLIELAAAGPRGMTRAEILTAYNARTIVTARLQRLVTGGQLEMRAGRYHLRRRGALVAASLLVALKVVLLGAPSEFGAGGRPSERPRS